MIHRQSYILATLGLAIFITTTPVSAQDDDVSTEDVYQTVRNDARPRFARNALTAYTHLLVDNKFSVNSP